ncbi:MAG: ferritin-like domain-containing protein, partial [Candidatus Dormibacteraceae bacterium]
KDLFHLIQQDEEAHVQAVHDTVRKLGGTPVAKPHVIFPQGTFQSRAAFIKLSKTFEETGVGAYLGAAGFIKNKDVLQAAAGIFGVECRHAAAVGYAAGLAPEGGIYMGATETAKPKADVLAAVMPFLGGSTPPSMPNTGLADIS